MGKHLKKVLSVILAAQLALSGSIASMAAELPDGIQAVGKKERQYVTTDQIKAVKASSFQAGYEPEKAVDGIENDANNCWHTPWSANPPTFPHWFQVEFTETQTLESLVYVARSATGYQFVTSYEVWISSDENEENLEKVSEGTWTRAKSAETEFDAREAKLVRFVAKDKVDSNYNDTYSVSASEIKFGLELIPEPGDFNEELTEMKTAAERVLAHVSQDVGEGEHQIKAADMEVLESRIEELEKLMDTADKAAVKQAVGETKEAIQAVLSGNMTEDETLLAEVSKSVMQASANSQNEGYEAGKAVDGDTSTIWHTQWEPESAERPHILTIDLGQSVLVDSIKITPRQDMSTGRITEGRIYAGNDPEEMETAAEFTGGNPGEISLGYRQARYIQIESLAGNGKDTAIAEVDVRTYDRGYAVLSKAYDDAESFLGNAQTGSEVGQYPKEEKDAFEAEVAGFAEAMKLSLLNSECYQLAEEIERAKDVFASKVNRYSLEDLKYLIEEGQKLADQLEGKDKELLNAAIETAKETADSADSTAVEIHNAAVTLKATIDGMRIAGEDRFDLSGSWDFKLGAYQEGEVLNDTVKLPGTLDENKKGTYNTFRDSRRLSRYYTYTGPALFQREVFIPNSWEGKQITLFMERSRETQVWVNGTEILAPDSSNIMAVSQVYDLTAQVRFGEMNTIAIEVDNSYPNSPRAAITNSSMATEETQTNWNGIVGTFELRTEEPVYIEDLRVYPNADLKSATVQVDVSNETEEKFESTVSVFAEGLEKREISVSVEPQMTVTVSIDDYQMGDQVKLWSEFEKNLYTMTAELPNRSRKSEEFGMRIFGVDPDTKQLTNNGNKVFLRSEANCAVFPLTAYAPMDEAGWEKLFSTYQSYGINAVRFHSWCPPDAAFRVADRKGMYLQPELSCWDAGSMFGDANEKEYYAKEAKAIVKEYANHPSFVMFTFGNELHFASGGYEYADQLIQELKAQDSTRLYSFASNGDYGSTKPTENSDFFTGQVYNGTSMRGIFAGMSGFINQTHPASVANYNQAVKRAADESGVPAFSFEVGQFQVFPDVVKELDGYTGVLEPRNLQLVEERLADKGISDETVEQYINASGMLSRLGYRMEIEAALRTKHMSGISLLGIQDFSGQSTALVGMMNALGDAKPYDFANPEEFSTFFSPEVALLEIEKFAWTNAETLKGNLLLANYGPSDLAGEMTWKLADGETVVAEGATEAVDFLQGDVTGAGEISIPLSDIKEAKQLKLTIALGDVENYYDIWVYPAEERAAEGEVYITEYLDEEALYILEDGGKVFLAPKANKATLPQSITGTFTTAFWSSQFVSESQPGSMGLLMDPEHPVFAGFPTEYHSNYQWWPMAKLGRPMILENLTQEDGTKIEPLVQVLDSFSTIRTMGLLYEAKVGDGKLMVSSMGLEQLQNQYPEAKALRNSILNYMNSDDFDPQFEVTEEQIQESVIGTEEDPRVNLAEKSNGGNIELGENTITCQIGYDNNPQDRKLELNDGRVDVETSSRSWTDWNAAGEYPDAEVIAILDKAYVVDTIVLPFFEDYGCKAPESIKVEYLSEDGFKEVSNPSKTTGFVKGNNTITFDAVTTTEIRITMVHKAGMGVALSEFIVYEKEIPAESLQIVSEDNKTEVKVGETLALGVTWQPENANDTSIRWTVLDEEGNKSSLAKVSLSGILTAVSPGKVIVKAALRSNPEVAATMEITILPQKTAFYQDVTEDDWFYDAVYLMAEKDLMTGIVPGEIFGANQVLPRAQFAEILYRMSGEEKVEAGQEFLDVPEDAWYADAVAWAAKNKIVTGYADGETFGPADPITREQMAVMLYRYAQYKGYDMSASGDYSKFEDASKVSTFAEAAMQWAVGNGIILGREDGTILDPQGDTLRCECAVMLARALQIFEN